MSDPTPAPPVRAVNEQVPETAKLKAVIRDLHRQATEERSHFYVGRVLQMMLDYIEYVETVPPAPPAGVSGEQRDADLCVKLGECRGELKDAKHRIAELEETVTGLRGLDIQNDSIIDTQKVRIAQLEADLATAKLEVGQLHGRIGLFAEKWFLVSNNLSTDETFKQMEIEICATAQKYVELLGQIESASATPPSVPAGTGELIRDLKHRRDFARRNMCDKTATLLDRAIAALSAASARTPQGVEDDTVGQLLEFAINGCQLTFRGETVVNVDELHEAMLQVKDEERE